MQASTVKRAKVRALPVGLMWVCAHSQLSSNLTTVRVQSGRKKKGYKELSGNSSPSSPVQSLDRQCKQKNAFWCARKKGLNLRYIGQFASFFLSWEIFNNNNIVKRQSIPGRREGNTSYKGFKSNRTQWFALACLALLPGCCCCHHLRAQVFDTCQVFYRQSRNLRGHARVTKFDSA